MRPLKRGALWLCVVGVTLHCWPERPGGDAAGSTSSGAGPIEGSEPTGYVLYSPLLSTTTYLVDRDGRVVHTWESDLAPGASVYLLDNGHLLRAGRHPGVPFRGGGQGGRLQEFLWDGSLVWDWAVASDEALQHHDIEPLPNGNLLLIAWETRTYEEAIQAGRKPDLLSSAGLWPDVVLEIEPLPPNGGRIVWEWHLWDHLIQDHYPERENYGRVGEHPELVDINAGRAPESVSEALLRRLRALGYLGAGATRADTAADFVHTNSIAYDPLQDQIVLSVNQYNEIWILDHSTSSREAASHAGGRRGKGGDLLYRWGNPRIYGRGAAEDQQLFGQHDARWIPAGYPGGGRLLVFNNGAGRPDGPYSSVMEIEPPLEADGSYRRPGVRGFGPDRPQWEYIAAPPRSFFAEFISGAERLRNGNTLICSGPEGRFFEVSRDREIVWEHRNPYSGNAPNPAGDPPFSVFRVQYVAPEHPALEGRRLEPLDPQPARARGRS